jgi:hypothetical protein
MAAATRLYFYAELIGTFDNSLDMFGGDRISDRDGCGMVRLIVGFDMFQLVVASSAGDSHQFLRNALLETLLKGCANHIPHFFFNAFARI